LTMRTAPDLSSTQAWIVPWLEAARAASWAAAGRAKNTSVPTAVAPNAATQRVAIIDWSPWLRGMGRPPRTAPLARGRGSGRRRSRKVASMLPLVFGQGQAQTRGKRPMTDHRRDRRGAQGTQRQAGR